MDFSYVCIKAFAAYSTNIFFREIVVINQQAIPKNGATIVYGNHNNQFVDAMLLINTFPRKVHFIAAAKSFRRRVLGTLIKMTSAIPVQRANDLSKIGPGTIIRNDKNILYGNDTKFTQLQIGLSIQIQNLGQFKIKQIISDFQIVVDKIPEQNIQKSTKYKIIPKIQYSSLYQSVWKHLNDGKTIGMFPQGGSHDRLQLLPLKAGICIMALGAMEKYNIPVTLIACGFNYYNPQNFRSKVIVQYGVPFLIPQQTLNLYKQNKKQAIALLLNQIQNNLKEVTTSIKNFNQLSTLFTCRQLYTLRTDKQLNQKSKLQLNRRFSKGYQILSTANNQQAIKLFNQVMKFDQYVRILDLPLRTSVPKQKFYHDFGSFIFYLMKTFNRLIFALPGYLLMGPTTTLITYLSERERIKCLKASKVKIQGNDVVGSYKILLSLVFFPFTNILNTLAIYKLLERFTKLDSKNCAYIALATYVLLPFYVTFMLRSYDSMFRTLKKLKFYFLRLFKRNTYEEYHKKRKQLSIKIRKMVDQHGGSIFQDFEDIRIIGRDQFKSQTENQIQIKSDHLNQ